MDKKKSTNIIVENYLCFEFSILQHRNIIRTSFLKMKTREETKWEKKN